MRLAISLVAALCTASALAQTTVPAFTPPKIPAQGVSLTDAERATLVTGLATLERELAAAAVELARDPRRLALLPDAEVFHKAVAWSLADDTFYSPKEIALARRLIETGRERVAQLRAGQAPWLQAKGLVVRGYRSQLDGSVQPYGLVVPESATAAGAPQPMMVWLLGRGEKRTELAFIAEREAGPPQLTPAGVLTLVPYGRFCNATKFAGEVDVMEALAAVRAQYPIDPQRIAVAGFSMGGGSTWHLATHFPGSGAWPRRVRVLPRRPSSPRLWRRAKRRVPLGSSCSGGNTKARVSREISRACRRWPTRVKLMARRKLLI
jgi:hypothetical protein